MKKYPALMGSLGRAQPKKDALAYRVWVHPFKGSDKFYELKSLTEIKKLRTKLVKSKKYAQVEPVIGVFEKKVTKFPSVKYWEARLK